MPAEAAAARPAIQRGLIDQARPSAFDLTLSGRHKIRRLVAASYRRPAFQQVEPSVDERDGRLPEPRILALDGGPPIGAAPALKGAGRKELLVRPPVDAILVFVDQV